MAERTQKKTKGEQKLSLKERLLKALQHPLRAKILAYMNDRSWSPRELQQELDQGLSQVSYHVKVLHDFDLIELTGTKPRRGAVEHFYCAVERAYIPSDMSKHIPKSGQRIIGDDILEEIDKDLRASLKSGKFYARDDWHASWTPADLDAQGCQDAERLADEFVERFLEIEAESATRRAEGGTGATHIATSAALLVFGSERGDQKKSPSRAPVDKKAGRSAKK
jgi:DNA-binding transcriptional ArsR family regulator